MGLAVRHIVENMGHNLHAYHVRRQDQRLEGAAIAGAHWAKHTMRGEGSAEGIAQRAQSAAEAWHARQTQERCDAYFDGLYG